MNCVLDEIHSYVVYENTKEVEANCVQQQIYNECKLMLIY